MVVTVVSKSNFKTLLPSILHHIRDADFITFDTELSGLAVNSQSKYFYYDELGERYRKLRESATNFGMLQIGLSAFKYKPSNLRFSSTTWSFHLFPSIPNTSGNNDFRRWMVQLSSIAFLREHGFDFNKTFIDGISFLSLKEEADLRAKQEQLTTTRNEKGEVTMKEEDALFVEETIENVRIWIQSKKEKEEKEEKEEKGEGEGEGGDEPLTLPPCNSFQRLLLYRALPKEFGKELVISKTTDSNGEICLSMVILDEEERKAILAEELASFEESITEQVGFRRIFDFILSLRKPIVGHNCWLDLCHIYSKFIGPLPNDWEGFRDEYAKLSFGPLFDTKYLASKLIEKEYLRVDRTSLETLALAVDDPNLWGGIKVKVDGGKTKNQSKQNFHDAGFDAYCTGKVFIGLITILAQKSNGVSMEKFLPEFLKESLEYTNRLFVMTSDYQGGALLDPESELKGKLQLHPSRTFLSVMTDLTVAISTNHILQALEKEGGCDPKRIKLFWVDNKTVFVSCENFEASETILKVQLSEGIVPVRFMSYKRWKEVQAESPSPPIIKRSRTNN